MALSLKTRKNIRDAVPKMEEALERIEQALGVKFTCEIDFAALIASKPDMDESQKESIGSLVYESYLGDFAYGLSSFVEESPMYKEAVLEMVPNHKITMTIINDAKQWKATAGKRSSSYCRTGISDGSIVLEIKGDCWCSNVHEVRQDLVHTFAGTGLSLLCRKNIADEAEKLEELLSEIETASGVKFEVEVDYAGLMASITRRDLDDSLGDFVKTYVEAIGRDIIRNCGSDDLNKEAVQELCATKKIKFQVYKDKKEYDKVKKDTNNYGRCRVVNGDLVIELHNESLYSNVDYFFDFNSTFAGV